jgi:predicted MFS family arabinose efflux permease
MMITTHTRSGKAVLTLAHVAGMIDMVALPLWIGGLMQHYQFGPPQAGLTVTLFLLGAMLASLFFAPRFNRLPRRAMTCLGFALAAGAFWIASRQPVALASFGPLAALHALAGVGTGCALSFTHGSIGRSANPHQLFGLVNSALGLFAVVFLGSMPQLVQASGASVFFVVVGMVMALGAVVTGLFFPQAEVHVGDTTAHSLPGAADARRIPRAAWFVIGAVICMTLNQAMIFSFVERIGAERGFGAERITAVLIALGLVNLLPGLLAALLQKKLSPVLVGFCGPLGQAALALTMTSATSFAPYALAVSLYVSMVIFTHTFLFGLLNRLDPSGRAAAATPAMTMVGACIGPALGGAVIHVFGYPGLGWAASAAAALAILGMAQVRRRLDSVPATAPART